MLLLLDRLARRYGTDPGSVLRWDATRLSVAVEAMRAGEQVQTMNLQRHKGEAMAVIDLTRL